VAASTCAIAGSEGICTHADSTIASTSASIMPATMPGSFARIVAAHFQVVGNL
jgi:hypothetical protein